LQEVFYAAVRPLFGKYLTTADDILILRTVYVFADTDTIGIVKIKDKVVAPLFSHDQRVAEVVDMLNGSYRLTCADTLVVVFKRENGGITPFECYKLALIVVNISVLGAVIIIPCFLDIIKVIVYISYRKIILDGYFT
jgi:hypothetical protein